MEKPFDIHGYDYSAEAMAKFIMATTVDVRDRLLGSLVGGGKAFGLELCAKIVKDSGLIVPEWMIVNKTSQHEDVVGFVDSLPVVIVRSSGMREDWLDPRSGVEESRVRTSGWALKEIDNRLSSGEPVVVQEYVDGCGCVIDIAYSELLQRPVARVARGNRSAGGRHSWTSATWDRQAWSAVYDLQTGEILVGSSLTFGHDWADPFPQIIRWLVAGLNRLNITFGVQFEVIVDAVLPRCPAYLVQVRPSPEGLRDTFDKPETSGRLLSATAGVNKAGVVTGEVLVADDELAHCCNQISGLKDSRVKPESWWPDLRGKIVLWDFSHLKYNSAQRVNGAGRCGAVGQITAYSIFTNSGHGTFFQIRPGGYEHTAWLNGRHLGLQFGRIGEDIDRRLRRLVKERTVVLQLISDGLVGQICLLEDGRD